MAAELITLPFRPVINTRGVLEPGALLDVFETGTTTRISVFSDPGLTTPLTNPVVADASGVFPSVYFDNAQDVRVRVRTAAGATIGDADPYFSDGLSAESIVLPGGDTLDEQFPDTITSDKSIQFYDFFGFPTIKLDNRAFFFHGEGTTAADDIFSVRIDRRADFDGGTFGVLNTALRINSIVTGQSLSFENGITLVQDNSAERTGTFNTTPQHHGMVIQVNRLSTAPAFCQVLEAVDKGAANPLEGCGAQEIDIQGTGTDSNQVRYGTTYVVRRQGDLSGWTGTACEAGFGIVFIKQPDDAANNRFKTGIGFGRFAAQTEFDVGIDFLYADCTLTAIRLANEKIDFGFTNQQTMSYIGGGVGLRYDASGGRTFDFKDNGNLDFTGNLNILGTQVVTSRRTGWTAATGTADRTTFATSTVTTEQLAERVKALIDDLITHGLIGA
jgi:hypothetical protein